MSITAEDWRLLLCMNLKEVSSQAVESCVAELVGMDNCIKR